MGHYEGESAANECVNTDFDFEVDEGNYAYGS